MKTKLQATIKLTRQAETLELKKRVDGLTGELARVHTSDSEQITELKAQLDSERQAHARDVSEARLEAARQVSAEQAKWHTEVESVRRAAEEKIAAIERRHSAEVLDL